jgi:hypothetical protein
MPVVKKTTNTIEGPTVQLVPHMEATGLISIMHNGSEIFNLSIKVSESLADALHDAVFDVQCYLDSLDDKKC